MRVRIKLIYYYCSDSKKDIHSMTQLCFNIINGYMAFLRSLRVQ